MTFAVYGTDSVMTRGINDSGIASQSASEELGKIHETYTQTCMQYSVLWLHERTVTREVAVGTMSVQYYGIEYAYSGSQ